MLAIDTSVIVRYLTKDRPDEAERARALIDGGQVFVASTVLLETEWILRSVYGFERKRVVAVLRAFAGLDHVRLEEPDMAAQALAWADAGMDFADGLHLAKAAACEGFATFDRRFGRAAAKLTGIKVNVL